MSTRQYARLVHEWVTGIGLPSEDYGTHSQRRTGPSDVILIQTGSMVEMLRRCWTRRRLDRTQDRKSVVSGKSLSVRVVTGGRRIRKTNKHKTANFPRHLQKHPPTRSNLYPKTK